MQFWWENRIPIRLDQFALLIIVMMMREYGLLKEADAWFSTCKWYSCFGSKFMRRSWNSREQQQPIWSMLPPPGTKLEKQKPGNLEYRQNQGETEGGKLIEEETNTWRWTSSQAQDPLHRKNWIKKDMSCRWEEEIQKRDRSTFPKTWENYDHIIEEETPENACRMIDFLLWTPRFRCGNKGTGNTAREHRSLTEKEERSESKSTRVGPSLLLLLQNEWKDMHHWRSPWHHHARCRHRRIPAKHASTSTKHSTGLCCFCCKKGRQQRKRSRDWSR